MDGVYKHYVIDLSCNNNFVQVPTVQGDGNNVRGFEVELISNNTQYVVDAENTIVSIAGTKPDTKQILNSCEVTEEGFILVDITNQMSAVAGRGDYSITLMDKNTNSLLQSFPFYILTTKSAFNASDVVSSNEFKLLTESTVNAKKATEDTIKATKDMRELEIQVIESEKLRNDSEILREDFENARKIAEQNRELAEQKRQEDTANAIQNVEKAIDDTIKVINDAHVAIQSTNEVISRADNAIENTIIAKDNAIEVTENAIESVERIEQLEQNFSNAENIRVQNENERVFNELNRQETASLSIEQLNTATNNTIEATNRANTISEELETKLANGEFNGKDGVDGKDGIVMRLDANEYYFEIVDDCLILTYEDGT